MKRYYFAHPYATKEIVRGKELEWESRYDIEIVNPFFDLNRDDVTALEELRITRRQLDCNTLVQKDLIAIQSCDAIIAYISGDRSIGTPMEVFFSWQLHKPVHAIVTCGEDDHPWLRRCCEEIYLSFDEFEHEELLWEGDE